MSWEMNIFTQTTSIQNEMFLSKYLHWGNLQHFKENSMRSFLNLQKNDHKMNYLFEVRLKLYVI